MPIGFEDLPLECQLAYHIYNRLGNRVYGDVGFVGKDYTNLPMLIEIHNIFDKCLLLTLLTKIESIEVADAQKKIKKMYDDMKKKTK